MPLYPCTFNCLFTKNNVQSSVALVEKRKTKEWIPFKVVQGTLLDEDKAALYGFAFGVDDRKFYRVRVFGLSAKGKAIQSFSATFTPP